MLRRRSHPRVIAVAMPLTLAGLTACSGSTPPPTRVQGPAPTAVPCPGPSGDVLLTGMPDLTIACLGPGPALRIAKGDGRPTVINLWASWCGPCADEMPRLQREFARGAGTVRFLGVDTDDERSPASALLAYARVTYPQVDDRAAKVRSALQVPGLPVTLVFDRRGRLVSQHVGAISTAALQKATRIAAAS